MYAEKLNGNPSLRVSGHVSSMNRTFIVEGYAEDDFGQWAKDEVTGEQGYVDERSFFWTWDDTEGVWQSRPYKGRQLKRRNRKGKGSTKVHPKEAEEHSLAKNKHEILKCGQKRKGKKGLSNGNDGFQKGGFRPYNPAKGAGKDYSQNKEK